MGGNFGGFCGDGNKCSTTVDVKKSCAFTNTAEMQPLMTYIVLPELKKSGNQSIWSTVYESIWKMVL